MKTFLLSCISVMLLFVAPLSGRGFLSGSNPSMTVFAFPQDILLMPEDFAFYYTTFKHQPWWGHIDIPDQRPGTSYLLTGERIGTRNSSPYFGHQADIYHLGNTAGFTRTFSPRLKTRFDLQYSYTPLRSSAEGKMINESNSSLDFMYKETLSRHDFYLTSYFATLWRDIPLGFKVGAGQITITEPHLKWEITENGTTYSADRLMWAWSSMQGGAVFRDYSGSERARGLDRYSAGSYYQLDLQTAATFEKLKAGGRFRYKGGYLDQYRWQGEGSTDSLNPASRNNLTGSYINADARKTEEKTLRLYGNYNWIREEKFLFNTLVLTRYTAADSSGVLPADLSSETGTQEKARTFVLQVNPNVSIYPWQSRHTYVDLAILCNYSYTALDLTRLQWVAGGQKRSYINSSVGNSEDYPWHRFSYSRQSFFELAFDANPTFPIFGNREQSLAMNISLLLWIRWLWENKYYGNSVTGPSDVTFDIRNIRKNFDQEIWLNSVLNAIYRRNGYTYRLVFGQPLTYSTSPVTSVYESNGRTLVSKVRHENMWASESGVQIGLFIAAPLEKVPVLKNLSR